MFGSVLCDAWNCVDAATLWVALVWGLDVLRVLCAASV